MGVAKNMLVQVGKFVFPVDFIILQMEELEKTEKPFTSIKLCIILTVKNKELNLGVTKDRETFHINKAMQHYHMNNDTCFRMDGIDDITEDELYALLDNSKPFLNTSEKISETSLDKEFDEYMSENVQEDEVKDDFEELPPEYELRTKKSIQDPPTDLEMKHLPKYLEYAFLEKNSLLPVFISALLEQDKKERLVLVLKNHKEAIAWKKSDIPGISPSFCKHKINFEDNVKPIIQRERRLNPNMKQVVKMVIIKLLDACIICAIEDSPWGAENVAADYLSRLEKQNIKELNDEEINDEFPDEFLMSIKTNKEESLWFDDFANYLVGGILRKGLTYIQRSAILTLRLQEKNDFCSCMSSMNCDFKHMRIPNSTKPEPKPIMIKKLRVRNEFKVEFKVLMYDSKYKFNAPKIRPKWCGPFTVRHDYPSEYVELYDKHGGSFIVNGHRVKLYYVDEQLNKHTIEKIHLMFEEGIMKAIPFMAPFPTDYHETMPWASEKPYIYNVVENTCNKAKLYDLDETGKGIVIKKCLYILGDEASLEKK
nr:reverse transcriptase domain-containing protein [Tanacetum cinerariifolium]